MKAIEKLFYQVLLLLPLKTTWLEAQLLHKQRLWLALAVVLITPSLVQPVNVSIAALP